MRQWLKDGTEFVHAHAEVLSRPPTWLFSSGPIGTEMVDSKGRDVAIEAWADAIAAQLQAPPVPAGT